MSSGVTDPHRPLLRWLTGLLADIAPPDDGQLPIVRVENLATSCWQSATFSGHRHVLDLRLAGRAVQLSRAVVRLDIALAKADPDLRGSVLVACKRLATVTRFGGAEVDLSFELLTLED